MRLLCYVCKNGNMYMANNSSNFQYCRGMSIEGVLVSTTQQSFIDLSMQINGRGGLNCEAKVQVLVITLPLFFEVGRKKGGVTAWQYGIRRRPRGVPTLENYFW